MDFVNLDKSKEKTIIGALTASFLDDTKNVDDLMKGLLEKSKSDQPEDKREKLIEYISSTESVFPDAFTSSVAKEVGIIDADPILLRGAALLAEQRVTELIKECLMLIKVRSEGRLNRVTKEVKYVLTYEILEEVIKMKHLPHPFKK